MSATHDLCDACGHTRGEHNSDGCTVCPCERRAHHIPGAADEIIAMWEDLIHLFAFQLIHGPEAGYRRFRYLRFGVPENKPLPAGVDLTKIQPPPGWGSSSTPGAGEAA